MMMSSTAGMTTTLTAGGESSSGITEAFTNEQTTLIRPSAGEIYLKVILAPVPVKNYTLREELTYDLREQLFNILTSFRSSE